jgi:hypothetical protein
MLACLPSASDRRAPLDLATYQERTSEKLDQTRRRALSATIVAFITSFAILSGARAETVRGVQYFHPEFEHYFMTADAAEIAALDAGVHAGWFRTGTFYQVASASAPGLAPVCRFFSTLGGKATHFFTAFPHECELVKSNPDWLYEGVVFHTLLPDGQGMCPEGTRRIHRLYNDGHGGSPNHVYTPSALKRDQLRANCDASIGCYCSFGLSLRDWEVRPNPHLSGTQPNEHSQECPTHLRPSTGNGSRRART